MDHLRLEPERRPAARVMADGATYGAARRSIEDVGGYPGQRVEDIALLQRLLARAPPAFLPLAMTTDARKFVQMGVWTSLGRVIAILLCSRFALRLPQAFFADIR